MPARPTGATARGAGRAWIRALRHALLLLATTLLPQTASPVSLGQLLGMPIERLLSLEVSSARPAPAPPGPALARTGGPP